MTGRKFDGTLVPSGWVNTQQFPFAEDLYTNVAKPYCRTCHMSQTTFPFDTVGGRKYIEVALEAMATLDLPESDKARIFETTARRLFNLPMD